MFISVLDLFKVGVGPSSSHTMGPMIAAHRFRSMLADLSGLSSGCEVQCVLKGSLAHTGRGHGTDKAVILGLHGFLPDELIDQDVDALVAQLRDKQALELPAGPRFQPETDLVFDLENTLPAHPNGMEFYVYGPEGETLLSQTLFSIGGGFIATPDEIASLQAPIRFAEEEPYPYPFETAAQMLSMANDSGLDIAQMKQANELCLYRDTESAKSEFELALMQRWQAMKICVERGLESEGVLPGGLNVQRRAASLYRQLSADRSQIDKTEWLCAYAMAVNEENAAGHMVVTAPTNGAAGVIPAVLYYFVTHEAGSDGDILVFLLTAGAVGGLIKHRSSISGAEVGCQGEVGSAAAMAAAGLCAVKGGTPAQIENAAEIALEHHLGMTCDPVKGLVQVPCIERNGFGAIKAYTAASLALKGSGRHFMSLDNCIDAMRETGMEMSHKYKETALGGLAQSWTEC